MKKLFVFLVLVLLISSFRQKKITWVAIGDSITYLNEHPDETDNRIDKGYMTRVAEKMPGLKYFNQGHNGWTAGNIADSIDKLGIQQADVYSVFLGTNDWWQGRPIGSITDFNNNTGSSSLFGSFRIIIDKIKTLNPHARIILITPMQRADFVYVSDYRNNAYGSYKEKAGQSLRSFADAVKRIGALNHYAVVDLYNNSNLRIEHLVNFKRLKDPSTGLYKNFSYPAYTAIPFNPDTDEYPYPPKAINMTYDGLHPSNKGYQLISQLLLRYLK